MIGRIVMSTVFESIIVSFYRDLILFANEPVSDFIGASLQ